LVNVDVRQSEGVIVFQIDNTLQRLASPRAVRPISRFTIDCRSQGGI